MGLDIYLRKCPDLQAAKAAESAAYAATNALWESAGPYEALSDQATTELHDRCTAINAGHGCNEDGRHTSITEHHSADSVVDPSHMFKLGYFRSSYNEGGIERVMGNLGLPTLHDIFGVTREQYEIQPDWSAALERATQAIDGYAAFLASDAGRYRVSLIRPMFDRGVKTEKEALDAFLAQMRQNGERGADWSNYSTSEGEFWLKGLKVHAVITKTYERPRAGDVIGALIGGPSVFVVYEQERDAGKEDWYLTALRIVRESIEFVLAQPDKQHYYLVWSG